MARIRLRLFSRERQTVVLADPSTLALEFHRLTALLRFGTETAIRDGLMDTGAPVTVVPERVWRFDVSRSMSMASKVGWRIAEPAD